VEELELELLEQHTQTSSSSTTIVAGSNISLKKTDAVCTVLSS
jgi:hypothetical protein